MKKYLKLLKVQLYDTDITEAVTLESNTTIPLSDDDTIKYEELDKRLTKCTQLAEKNAEFFYEWCSVLTRVSDAPQSNKSMVYTYKEEQR